MRKCLFILLLPCCLVFAPGPAAAVTYKCVIKGETTYSQEPCAADAQKVDTKGALSGVGVPTAVPAATSNTAAPPAAKASNAAGKNSASSGDSADDNSCAARLKAYHESLACFAPYRHSGKVIDTEAYNHCKVVAEPTDCEANGM